MWDTQLLSEDTYINKARIKQGDSLSCSLLICLVHFKGDQTSSPPWFFIHLLIILDKDR